VCILYSNFYSTPESPNLRFQETRCNPKQCWKTSNRVPPSLGWKWFTTSCTVCTVDVSRPSHRESNWQEHPVHLHLNDYCTVQMFTYLFNSYSKQSSRYAIWHIWCLSQARINWEGCGMKSIRRKTGGRWRWGGSMVQIGRHPAGLSAHLSSPRLIKSWMMTEENMIFWMSLPVPAHRSSPGQRTIKWLFVCISFI